MNNTMYCSTQLVRKTLYCTSLIRLLTCNATVALFSGYLYGAGEFQSKCLELRYPIEVKRNPIGRNECTKVWTASAQMSDCS